jgi:hypothetical protein
MNRFAIVEQISSKIKYTEEQRELINSIEDAMEELNRARQYFEMVNEPQLIDYAIHLEDAAKARFTYLLNKAKEIGLTVENKFLQNDSDAV